MDFLRFENQEFFYLFAAIPLLLIVFMIARYLNKKALGQLNSTRMMPMMVPMHSNARPWIKMILFSLAFCFMVLAAVNPQLGYKTEEAKSSGVDIIIALDVSRSMMAEDIKPNRLERSKMAISRFLDQLESDRVGLVLFAGTSVTQVPITGDKEIIKMMLRNVETGSVPLQGTSVEAALQRSLTSFSPVAEGSRVILLISDGENHEDSPIEAAKRASENNVIIHSVGVGTVAGSPIPVYQNGRLTGFLRDQEGNTVISRFDQPLLEAIAKETGGTFSTGTGPDLGLNDVKNEIRKMQQAEFEATHFSEYESKYHYFVALAIILLLAELFIFERKSRWLSRINLFDVQHTIK